MDALQSYFKSVDRQLGEEIASRPADLRLPRKGFRFRTLRDTVVDVVTYFRGGEDDLFLTIEIKQGTIPHGEVIRLDYQPVPSESTRCSLVPERYGELEMSFVDTKLRDDAEYSHFNFSVSYPKLDKEFDWLYK
jgi:hypothetical protein